VASSYPHIDGPLRTGYRIPYSKEVGYASIEQLAHIYHGACTYVIAPRLATKLSARNAPGNHEARWVRFLLPRRAGATLGDPKFYFVTHRGTHLAATTRSVGVGTNGVIR
jgi:hypothetical protein